METNNVHQSHSCNLHIFILPPPILSFFNFEDSWSLVWFMASWSLLHSTLEVTALYKLTKYYNHYRQSRGCIVAHRPYLRFATPSYQGASKSAKSQRPVRKIDMVDVRMRRSDGILLKVCERRGKDRVEKKLQNSYTLHQMHKIYFREIWKSLRKSTDDQLLKKSTWKCWHTFCVLVHVIYIYFTLFF